MASRIIAVRAIPTLRRRIDWHLARLRAEHPDRKLSRSDAIRLLMLEGMVAAEARLGAHPNAGPARDAVARAVA